MKKILIAFGGTRFSESLFRFACRLNELQPVLLVGVFLPEVIYSNIYNFGTGLPGNDFVAMIDEEDGKTIQRNMDHFTELCQRNNLKYRLHNDYDTLALPGLKRETRFADLLIINSEKFYDSFGVNDPNPSMKEALHASECPVIVIPEKYSFPQCNILAYDGSASSVYAIKQFAYLFPEMCSNDTLLVYVNEKNVSELPEENNIDELVTQHFKNVDLLKLQLNAKIHFNTWLSENKSPILVGGSFGRSYISELFRKSFAAKIIDDHRIPVFIAHS